MRQRIDKRQTLFLSVRLLSQLAGGLTPSRRDIVILKRQVWALGADLPIEDLCCRIIWQQLRDETDSKNTAMTKEEVEKLRQLAGKAQYLARQRDIRRLTDAQYIELLNTLRKEHGLWPIRPKDSAEANH